MLRRMTRLVMFFSLLLSISAFAQNAGGDRTLTLLQRLADAPGPPGAEEPVRAIMVPEMKPFSTEPIRYDGIGSVIAQQGSDWAADDDRRAYG